MPEPLRFSHKLALSEDDYLSIFGLLSRRTRWLRVALSLVVGGVLLFWSYTLVLGVAVLAIGTVGLFEAHFRFAGSALAYKKSKHLHREVTYTLSDQGLEAENALFRAWSSWENVYMWRISGPWLAVYAYGSPNFLFRVSDLQKAGIWDRVDQLIRKCGVEFNSREAKKL